MPNDSAEFSPRTQTNMPTQPDKPSLYERLGGIYSIACVVDDLIDRIMTDARSFMRAAFNTGFDSPIEHGHRGDNRSAKRPRVRGGGVRVYRGYSSPAHDRREQNLLA
jgi:hypothetical protein